MSIYSKVIVSICLSIIASLLIDVLVLVFKYRKGVFWPGCKLVIKRILASNMLLKWCSLYTVNE